MTLDLKVENVTICCEASCCNIVQPTAIANNGWNTSCWADRENSDGIIDTLFVPVISPRHVWPVKMGENQNRFFIILIFLGLCATQALELKTKTSDTFKEAFSDSEYLRNLVQAEHFQSDIGEIRSVLSPLWGRSKRDSVARSRRQGLGLLPTEEENGELLQKVSLSTKSAHPYCLLSRNNRYFEKISVWLRLNWVLMCPLLVMFLCSMFNSEFNKRSCHIPISSAWSKVDMKWTFPNILSTLLFKSVYILNVSACLILNKVISNPPLRIFEF